MRLRQLPDCLIFGTNQHFVILLQIEFANSLTRHIYGCLLAATQPAWPSFVKDQDSKQIL